MTFRGEITIRSSPATVWAAVSDPSLMPLWNPKCLKCERQEGSMRMGSRYKATFRMRGPEQETWCEVRDCVPTQLLTTRYSGKAFRNNGYVEETFRLTPIPSGTRLLHAVDFAHSGLPWLVRLLMQLVGTFGYSVGQSSLDGIRGLVEEGMGNQPSQSISGMPGSD